MPPSTAAAAPEPSVRELTLLALSSYSASGHDQRARRLLAQLAPELSAPLAVAADVRPLARSRDVSSLALLLVTGAPYVRARPTLTEALRDAWQAVPALLVSDPESADAIATRTLALAARGGSGALYGQALSLRLARYTQLIGRPSRLVDRQLARAKALTRDATPWERAFVQVMHASVLMFRADHARAAALALDIAARSDIDSAFAAAVRACARAIAAPALWTTGHLSELSEHGTAWLTQAADGGDHRLEVCLRAVTANLCLRRDDPAAAQAALGRAAAITTERRHPALCDPRWQASLLLYEGEAQRARACCDQLRRELPAGALRANTAQLHWLEVDGLCAAAVAAVAHGAARERALHKLEQCALGARRLRTVEAGLVSCQLGASLEQLRDRPSAAITLLERAVEHSDALHQRLRSASLRLSLAALVRGDGLRHERAALRVFEEERIANPLRWAYMLAPGLSLDVPRVRW